MKRLCGGAQRLVLATAFLAPLLSRAESCPDCKDHLCPAHDAGDRKAVEEARTRTIGETPADRLYKLQMLGERLHAMIQDKRAGTISVTLLGTWTALTDAGVPAPKGGNKDDFDRFLKACRDWLSVHPLDNLRWLQ